MSLSGLNAYEYRPTGYCPSCGYPCDPGTCTECGRVVKRPLRRDPRVGIGRILRLARLVCIVLAMLAGVSYAALAIAYRYMPNQAVSSFADKNGWWFQRIASDVLSWRYVEYSRRASEHEKRICAEIATLPNHPWAGEYRAIGPFGSSVIFAAPISGFARYESFGGGCMAPSVSNITGNLTFDSTDELCFSETLQAWEAGPARAVRLLRFQWGPRRCLVSASQLDAFGDDAVPIYYLRDYVHFQSRERNIPLAGIPEIPQQFRKHFDLDWRLVTISSVQLTTRDPDINGAREILVSCTVDESISPDAEPVALFAEMPSAEVVKASDGTVTLQYTVTLQKGQTLIEPQIGWQFAYDWDDEDEEDSNEQIDSAPALIESNPNAP